jgi:hypothetical protein
MLHADEVMTELWNAKALNAKRQGGLAQYVARVLQQQAAGTGTPNLKPRTKPITHPVARKQRVAV